MHSPLIYLVDYTLIFHYYMTNFETYYPFTDGASTEAKSSGKL